MQAGEIVSEILGRRARILAIIADGRRSLGFAEATQWQALALARWELLRALSNFVSYKTDKVLDPLITEGDSKRAGEAATLKAENHLLEEVYNAFVQRWALTSPLSVDEPYRVEAMRMSERIERQVNEDVRVLEALVGPA